MSDSAMLSESLLHFLRDHGSIVGESECVHPCVSIGGAAGDSSSYSSRSGAYPFPFDHSCTLLVRFIAVVASGEAGPQRRAASGATCVVAMLGCDILLVLLLGVCIFGKRALLRFPPMDMTLQQRRPRDDIVHMTGV